MLSTAHATNAPIILGLGGTVSGFRSAVTSTNQLGEYLRARRELVSPEDVDLPTAGRRRVAGLRREEVAMLAGISADYYLRLEQGRGSNPSLQVLESIARVLRLDDTATSYLIELSGPKIRREVSEDPGEAVPAGIRRLVDSLGVPAFIESRYFDVLASNDLARALTPNLVAGTNRLLAMFLDPEERALCPKSEQGMADLVAGFRQSVGTRTDDPRFAALVDELSSSNEQFRRLWARHDVRVREGTSTDIYHPRLGALTLGRERLAIAGDDGSTLVVYHAEPGSESAEKLALLGAPTVSRSTSVGPA